LLKIGLLTFASCSRGFLKSEEIQKNSQGKESIRPVFIPRGDTLCSKNSKGYALFLHGLNNHSGVLGPISEVIGAERFTTRAITLAGHEGGDAQTLTVSLKSWRSQVDNFLLKTSLNSCTSSKFILVGYSTGALLWIDALERAINVGTIDSINGLRLENISLLLFAPPLSLRPIIKFASIVSMPLLMLSPFGLSLPTLVPLEARASDYISLGLYRSFFDLYGKIQKRVNGRNLPLVKSLVIVHSEDELINFEGINTFVKRYGNSLWSVQVIKTSMPSNSYKHLFILPKHGGRDVWEQLKLKVINYVE
jgi:pimeloyl-ACP methyl ester carboxylesterase